jgi:Transcriptional activator of glycolytic enzymes
MPHAQVRMPLNSPSSSPSAVSALRQSSVNDTNLDNTIEQNETDHPSMNVQVLHRVEVPNNGRNDQHEDSAGTGDDDTTGSCHVNGIERFLALYRELACIRIEVQRLKADVKQLESKLDLQYHTEHQEEEQARHSPSIIEMVTQMKAIKEKSKPMELYVAGNPKNDNNHPKSKKSSYDPMQTKNSNVYADLKSLLAKYRTTSGRATMVDRRRAVLCYNPKTLYVLWQEYMYGMDGNKPVKDWTRMERGAGRPRYTHRKIVWDQIVRLMQSKKHSYPTAEQAIEKIYHVYGKHTNVSTIIKLIRRDHNLYGDHPELRDEE